MNLLAVGLLLASALLHATWNLMLKRRRDKLLFTWFLMLSSAAFCTPLLALICLSGPLILPPVGLFYMLASSAFVAAYFIVLSRAYEAGDLSLVYPLNRGLAPIFTLIWSVLLLGERPSALGLAGILLVVAGAYTLHLPGFTRSNLLRPLKALRSRSSRLAVLAALLISLYCVADKVGVSLIDPLAYVALAYYTRSLLLGAYVLKARWGHVIEGWRESRRALAIAGVATPMNYILALLALRLTYASYMVAIRQSSVVFGVIMGSLLLREAHGKPRLVGSLLMLAGITLVSLAT